MKTTRILSSCILTITLAVTSAGVASAQPSFPGLSSSSSMNFSSGEKPTPPIDKDGQRLKESSENRYIKYKYELDSHLTKTAQSYADRAANDKIRFNEYGDAIFREKGLLGSVMTVERENVEEKIAFNENQPLLDLGGSPKVGIAVSSDKNNYYLVEVGIF